MMFFTIFPASSRRFGKRGREKSIKCQKFERGSQGIFVSFSDFSGGGGAMLIFDFHKSFKLLIDITPIHDMEKEKVSLRFPALLSLSVCSQASAQAKFPAASSTRSINEVSLAAINFCVVCAHPNTNSVIFIARKIQNRLLTLSAAFEATYTLPCQSPANMISTNAKKKQFSHCLR